MPFEPQLSDLDDDEILYGESDVEVEHLNRKEFIHDVFAPNYEAGEHVTFIGPTGSGKTTVANEMAGAVATPRLPVVMLVMKPRDATVVGWTKRLGLKKTEVWPPLTRRDWRTAFTSKFRGFVFWPRHSLSDIRRDDLMLAEEFKRVLTECYKRGDRIVFADEVHGLQKELKLQPELDAIWMRGRSMGCGLWAATQRPKNISYNAYSQAEHLVLFKTPDMRDIEVYREIGGIDPYLVQNTVNNLEKYQFVYIGRTKGEDDEPTLAVVGA